VCLPVAVYSHVRVCASTHACKLVPCVNKVLAAVDNVPSSAVVSGMYDPFYSSVHAVTASKKKKKKIRVRRQCNSNPHITTSTHFN